MASLLSRLGFRANLLDLRIALWLTVGMAVVCTVAMMWIEGMSFIDAFYMAAITISTVGFGEVQPLSQPGRLFLSIFIILNVGVVAYALAAFSYYVIEGKIFEQLEASRMQHKVDNLNEHTILCGFGRYGKEITRHLMLHNEPFVIVEQKASKLENDEFRDIDLPYVLGDATEDDVLTRAGVDRARGLITALADDSDNMFIVLSARDLNPHLRVVSRAHTDRSRQKMIKAGANHVIMPEQIGGFYMATLISKPGAIEFFSYVTNELDSDIGFEEIRYDQLPAAHRGGSLKDIDLRGQCGVNVIGHRLTEGRYVINPGPDATLAAGESFIVVGSQLQVLSLRRFLKQV